MCVLYQLLSSEQLLLSLAGGAFIWQLQSSLHGFYAIAPTLPVGGAMQVSSSPWILPIKQGYSSLGPNLVGPGYSYFIRSEAKWGLPWSRVGLDTIKEYKSFDEDPGNGKPLLKHLFPWKPHEGWPWVGCKLMTLFKSSGGLGHFENDYLHSCSPSCDSGYDSLKLALMLFIAWGYFQLLAFLNTTIKKQARLLTASINQGMDLSRNIVGGQRSVLSIKKKTTFHP